MTNKQKKFIYEYLQCWNATQAALNAGYSERSAGSIGHELLKKPEIQVEIQKEIENSSMKAEEALLEIASIARGDLTDLMEITHSGFIVDLLDEDGNVKEQAKNIRKIKQKVTTIIGKNDSDDDKEIIETEIEMYDRKDALKTMLQHYGQLKDYVENSGESKLTIEFVNDWRDVGDED